MGSSTTGVSGSPEWTLSADEWKRLDQLDSRQFGFINLQDPADDASLRDRQILHKALRIFEKRLLNDKKPDKKDNKDNKDKKDDKNEKNEKDEKDNKDDKDDKEAPDTEDPDVYLKLGHIHLLSQDFAKALSAYQRVFALNRQHCWKDPSFFYGLGLVYFHFRAYEFAAETFQQVLYVTPLFQRINEVHLRLGLVYKALEDFDLALKHLNCVFIDCSPCTLNKLEIRFHIAHCYDSRGDLQRAYHEYNVLLHDLQSHSSFNLVKASVFRQLAWLCYRTECEGESRLQKLNEAVANLHESLKYDPNSGKTYYYLGRCYGAIPGRAHDAFVNYRQSIDKSEADADTWCSIGVLYQQQNQPMDALQAYICAVQLDGHHSAAWTDLGWLYEVHQQFDDALQCFKKAVKYKPAAPEALKARIQLLEKELKSAPPLSTPKQPPVRQPLPSLEKAWKLPIPAELTQRQDDFLRHKYQRYKDGSGALWTMGILNTELEAAGQEKPSYYLSQTQMQMMQILQQNQQRLDVDQMSVLQQLQHKYSLMQQDLRRSDMQRRMQPNVQPHKMITASQLGQATPQHGELPLVSQDDIMNILGGPPPQPAKEAIKRHSSTTEDDILLGGLGDTGESSGKHDPMLSSAALTSKDASRDGSQPDSMSSAHASRLQEERVSSTSDVPEMSMSTPIKSEVGCPPPPALSLLSKVNLALNCTASELLQACAKRAEGSANGFQIFDERVRPPSPPPPPKEHIPKDKLLRPTPLVLIDARKDATAPELQQFCYNSPIALIRGLTSTLKMDLSLFSTKSLMETAPEHDVEVRTQYKMPPDANFDQLGEPTWHFESTRSFTTVAKYAQYQAQSFQHSLKEEQEKLRATSTKQADYEPFGKRRRDDEATMPMRQLKFGTNVDLSDESKWRSQLVELAKIPAFCRIVAGCNLLTHLGHTVLGMNTVQLYMKVPGCRTPAHQENNSFASININIGPGECEWFAVPYEYWGSIRQLCAKRGVNFLKGSWWPGLDDLYEANIPVYRFTQKAGDLVYVGGGCIHWVQATGWCNNVAWNVGPVTSSQYEMALRSHEWNRLKSYKSLVPMQHLTWQIAKNLRLTNARLFEHVRQTLIRSLAYCRMVADYAESVGKQIKLHPRTKGEVAHYCNTCEIEVFNLLFVLEQNHKFIVHCVDCARRTDAQLTAFVVLQQITFEELSQIFDSCQLNPHKQGVIC